VWNFTSIPPICLDSMLLTHTTDFLFNRIQVVLFVGFVSENPFFSADMQFSLKLAPLSRVLLDKLIVSQLIEKFPIFYGIRKFITAFRTARHWSLS
jgi:hypothetical protein